MDDVRVGLGFDVHPSEPGRALRLGGVHIEDAIGLAGHSDGDVVCHAVADAVLGAAGLGDIGRHFPDTDAAFEGIAGLDLLSRVTEMTTSKDLDVRSCDLTVVAERPAIAPHADLMRTNLALALGVGVERVSVKASRPEGLGLTGDGVGCLAVVLLAGR